MFPSTGPVLQGKVEAGHDRRFVLVEPSGERLHLGDRAVSHLRHPRVEVGPRRSRQQMHEALAEVIGAGEGGVGPAHPQEQGALGVCEIVRATQIQRGEVARGRGGARAEGGAPGLGARVRARPVRCGAGA